MSDDILRLGTTDRRLDVEAVTSGIEKECVFRPGLFVTFLPAATFNDRYARALIARSERISRVEDDRAFEQGTRMDHELVVDGLVVAMRGIRTADGTEVPYTREVGVQVLGDPSNADVLSWVSNESRKYAAYYTDRLEDDLGNSSTDSSGSSAGVGKSEKTSR